MSSQDDICAGVPWCHHGFGVIDVTVCGVEMVAEGERSQSIDSVVAASVALLLLLLLMLTT